MSQWATTVRTVRRDTRLRRPVPRLAEFIADRQRGYLPLLEGRTRIVDLGCGRGEFLELLREQGIEATGMELDATLVERCRCPRSHRRARGCLRLPRLGARCIPRRDLLRAGHRALPVRAAARNCSNWRTASCAEDGLFIAETVNPESHEALKTFFVDLTHQRPIYPQVLLYLCRQARFRSARIFYPCAGGFTQAQYQDSGEYAVVALR